MFSCYAITINLANHIRLLLVAIVSRWKSAGWPFYCIPEYSSFILYKPHISQGHH